MANTFKSNDTPIAEILKSIDSGANQLPDFQRGWVWDDIQPNLFLLPFYLLF